MKIKISINGRAYDSLDDVPEELRELVDSDGNGVLDVLQKGFSPEASKPETGVEAAAGFNNGESLRDGIRSLLKDQNKDGLPDIVQKKLEAGPVQVTTRVSKTYTVNGKRYASIEDVPPAVRAALKQAGIGPSASPASAPDPDPDARAITPEPGFGIMRFLRGLFKRG